MIDLRGRAAPVTGGSRGIGRACCELLGRAGTRLAVNYRAEAVAATRVVEAIRAAGGNAFELRADLSRREDADALVAEAAARRGGLRCAIRGEDSRGTPSSWDGGRSAP